MTHIDPREATITFNDHKFTGIISGTKDYVKFQSSDEAFLKLFPSGEFDSLTENEKELNHEQIDVIDLAQYVLSKLLNDHR